MIGITGGIGSGKSIIAQAIAQRGYTVYDCDCEAKRIICEEANVRHAITDLLGREAFDGKRYNTAYVARRVFSEPQLLQRLNEIVHPAVKQDILQKKPDFIESAILYESGLAELCDRIIVIDAPEQIRIHRSIARDYNGAATPENIAEVKARMRTQASHAGDKVIVNDGKTPVEKLTQDILTWIQNKNH